MSIQYGQVLEQLQLAYASVSAGIRTASLIASFTSFSAYLNVQFTVIGSVKCLC